MIRSARSTANWIPAVLAAAVVSLAAAAPARPQPAPIPPTLIRSAAGTTAVLPSGRLLALPFSGPASLVAAPGGFLAAGVSTEGDLTLLGWDGEISGADGFTAIAAPAAGTARPRREPVLLTEAGSLAGLVWLEGGSPTRLEVWAAEWSGTGWEAPVRVAAPGPGSQLALAAGVLEDSSRLALWSAFDGEDDEILWSRGADGVWSAPRRLAADNRVPDVTPAILPSGGGALAAWSRYDSGSGQYRVVISRFAPTREGGSWSEPRWLGPPGSLFPSLEPLAAGSGAVRTAGLAGGSRVLFRTAGPRGWQVVDLDARDRPRRRAAVTAAAASPPRLVASRDGLRFEWLATDGGPAARQEAPWETLP